jgi:DNA gyrase/topoisomerase IV subunit A
MVFAAITIKEGDELLEAKLTNGTSQIILAVKSGKLVRFEESKPVRKNGFWSSWNFT